MTSGAISIGVYPAESHVTTYASPHVVTTDTARDAARIFLRGGAEIMEAKAMKRKNCL